MGTPGSYNFIYQNVYTTVNPNEIWTWSAYIKNDKVARFAIRLVLFYDTTIVKTQPTKYIDLDGTGGYERVDVSTSHADGGNRFRTDILSGDYYSTISALDVEFKDAQLEQKSHATPFVSGSRPTTDGLRDLSGDNRHIDLTTISYNSNAELYFESGSTDVLSAYVSGSILSTQGTFSAWVYPTGRVSNAYIFQTVGINTNRFYLQYTNGQNFYAVRGNPVGSAAIKVDVELNQWHFVTMTWTETTVYGYYNGVFTNSASYTSTSDYSNTTLTIGKQSSNATFPGKIDLAQVYNRKLLDAEILHNYKMLKKRFGL